MTAENRLSLKFFLEVYLATLCTVSLLAALAVVAVYRMAAVTLGFATPAWGWATVFVGHAASGALLLLGFVGLSTAMEPDRLKRIAAWRAGLAGLALGLAFITEFTAGPAVAIIGVCCGVAALTRPDRWTVLPRVFAPAAIGLALPLASLLAYNVLAFSSPLKLGYENVQGFPGMQTGFFGISGPDPRVALELLFGFMALLLPRLWDGGGRVLRGVFLLLLAVSIGLSLICAATDMFAPADVYPHPFIELLLPMFLSGDLHRALIARLPGVNGALAPLPLLLAWAAIGWSLQRRLMPRQHAA